MSVTDTPPARFDVCVVCALPEEFEAFERVVTNACKVSFQETKSHNGRPYRYAMIPHSSGKQLALHLSLPVEMGPEAMSLHLMSILKEFRPGFVAMSGICAGDRRKVTLGDLVVAERAFSYERGKVILDEDGKSVHLPDAMPYRPDPATLVAIRMFRTWLQEVKQLQRPPSKKQQRDWLLNRLLEAPEHRVKGISLTELEQHAPDWRNILIEWRQSSPPVLSPDRRLLDVSAIEDRVYGPEKFPFVDPQEPKLFIATMASGNAVHANDPFAEIQRPVRTAVAIDMESAVFYRVVTEEVKDIRSLVVKGVCDYADSEKDDSYHTYAAEVSALYLLSFIQQYITPRPSAAVPPARGLEPAPPDEKADALKLYFVSASKDARYRQEIEKHLIIQIRQGRITCWHSYEPVAGSERTDERKRYLREARLIPLLISPDLLTSESFFQELQQAYEHHVAGRARVIPVLLRQTNDWEAIPFGSMKLGDLEPVPHSRRFLLDSPRTLDEAYAGVAASITAVIKQMLPG